MSIPMPQLEAFLPVLLRIVAALMVLPIFGHRSVPTMVRIALSATIAWLLVSPGGIVVSPPPGLGSSLVGLLSETALGLLLGFAGSMAFWALSMAGEVMGLQMGWNFGATLHTSFETSSVATGQFYTITGSLIFLAIGGHRMFLSGLADTFVAVPPYAFVAQGLQASRIVDLVASLFSGAVQLSFPVLGTLILTEAVLAFLSRVMPQINAFVFGMPLKIGAGLLALWISLPVIFLLIERWLSRSGVNMQMVIR